MEIIDALKIAIEAHKNQFDKLGEPYILHPLRVFLNVEGSKKVKVVAILHDVLEDSDIEVFGLDEEEREALNAITRNKDEKYIDYINRVLNNNIATIVKLKDLEDNLSEKRLNHLDEKTRNRLIEKYSQAKKLIINKLMTEIKDKQNEN